MTVTVVGTAFATPPPPAAAGPVAAARSWDEVARTHSAQVHRLAYRLTGNRHDADDLTQDVFVRVFRHLATYTIDNFDGWLHRITTNLFLDQVRRRQRSRFNAFAANEVDSFASHEPEDFTLDSDIEAALNALAPGFVPPLSSATFKDSPTRRSPA